MWPVEKKYRFNHEKCYILCYIDQRTMKTSEKTPNYFKLTECFESSDRETKSFEIY